MASRFPVALAALTAILLGALAVPGARADCDGPYPSFREAAPSAKRVVYGDVVAVEPVQGAGPDGRSSRFVLEGLSVVGSIRRERVEVRDLQSQPCAGYLVARVGDRVAIAFEGRAFSPGIEVNAIAWLSGEPPDLIGIEVVTESEVYEILGIQPARVEPTRPAGPEPGIPWLAVIAALALGVGGALTLRRLRTEDLG